MAASLRYFSISFLKLKPVFLAHLSKCASLDTGALTVKNIIGHCPMELEEKGILPNFIMDQINEGDKLFLKSRNLGIKMPRSSEDMKLLRRLLKMAGDNLPAIKKAYEKI